jgi:GST-like protein
MEQAKNPAGAKRGRRLNKPIDLYYWPTPNGLEDIDHAGGARTALQCDPGEYRARRSVKPAFLEISPNNRMPAIVDPNGPGGRPISVFESGAILQYLGRKAGKFYPAGERARVAVDEWLFWQMANLGPKAGEANHFRRYAPERLPYALDRFGNEMNRLYGVMNTRLKDRRFLAGHYSIADMACVGWIRLFERQQEKEGIETFAGFPHLKRWLATVRARPAVQRGMHIRVEEASRVDVSDPKVRAVLFGQRAT